MTDEAVERSVAAELDRLAARVAEAENIGKGEAYDRLLTRPEGLRGLGAVRLAQGRREEAVRLFKAAIDEEHRERAR